MSYGAADHLWIEGPPPAETIERLLNAALRSSFGETPEYESYIADACRIGDERVLIDVQALGDKVKPGFTDAGGDFLVELARLAAAEGFRTTRILMGEAGDLFWTVEREGRGAELVEDELRTRGADGWHPDPQAAALARDLIRSQFDLPLEQVHHYIDWAEELRAGGVTDVSKVLPTQYLVSKRKRLERSTPANHLAPAAPVRLGHAIGVWSLVLARRSSSAASSRWRCCCGRFTRRAVGELAGRSLAHEATSGSAGVTR